MEREPATGQHVRNLFRRGFPSFLSLLSFWEGFGRLWQRIVVVVYFLAEGDAQLFFGIIAFEPFLDRWS